MRAIVYCGPGDVRLDEVRDPELEEESDAIVRLTASAISGFDLQIVRGSVPEMLDGTVLGHEGVGVVEDLGADVRNFEIGDRVLICPTLACGDCHACRRGRYAHCERANPNGPGFGPAMFGGPAPSGPFHGLMAEYARVPFAHTTLLRLPDALSDGEGLQLADALPSGHFAVRLVQLRPGQSLAVFGCGPAGQQAITCAARLGAGRIFAIDGLESRLDAARARGAEAIDLEREDPVEVIDALTQGRGTDCVIDAVPLDALPSRFGQERLCPRARDNLCALLEGMLLSRAAATDEAAQSLEWSVASAATGGTVALLCLQPGEARRFPLGTALRKGLTLRLGTCHHRKYLPHLIEAFEDRPGALEEGLACGLDDGASDGRALERRFFDLSPWS